MPGRPIRILAGLGWMVGGVVGWYVFMWRIVIFAEDHGRERGVMVPEPIVMVLGIIFLLGLVLIPSILAVLALRSKLPGTGDRSARLRGFPIEPKEPAER